MQTMSSKSRRTRTLTLRVDRASENRFALALVMLLTVATISVLATTSALSRHHASELLILTSP
jgi:hypothetical protein